MVALLCSVYLLLISLKIFGWLLIDRKSYAILHRYTWYLVPDTAAVEQFITHCFFGIEPGSSLRTESSASKYALYYVPGMLRSTRGLFVTGMI